MAVEFTKQMDVWVRKTPGRALPDVTREDFEMLSDDQLACKPRTERNIFSVNRDLAEALREKRSGLPLQEAAARIAHVNGAIPSPPSTRGPTYVGLVPLPAGSHAAA